MEYTEMFKVMQERKDELLVDLDNEKEALKLLHLEVIQREKRISILKDKIYSANTAMKGIDDIFKKEA